MSNLQAAMVKENNNTKLDRIENILGQSALSINSLSKQMGVIVGVVDTLSSDVDVLKTDVDNLKKKSEIDTNQKKLIKKSVHCRVNEILHNDPDEIARYYRGFIAKCWSDAKNYGGVASSYEETPKGNYQMALDYIEAWKPLMGIDKLKKEIDKKAAANRKAKKLGYK